MPQHVASAVAKPTKGDCVLRGEVSMGTGRFWARMSRRSGRYATMPQDGAEDLMHQTIVRRDALRYGTVHVLSVDWFGLGSMKTYRTVFPSISPDRFTILGRLRVEAYADAWDIIRGFVHNRGLDPNGRKRGALSFNGGWAIILAALLDAPSCSRPLAGKPHGGRIG
ncbi:uncharacterized protein PG986_006682 [Apiospora aurea]|uniref:Uncharacterized protein n=1 Tax=Apiospora aurea TaxID=335848 RepID=A0ABR1QAN8_9PEZI